MTEVELRRRIEDELRKIWPVDIEPLAARITAAIGEAMASQGHSSGYQLAAETFCRLPDFIGGEYEPSV